MNISPPDYFFHVRMTCSDQKVSIEGKKFDVHMNISHQVKHDSFNTHYLHNDVGLTHEFKRYRSMAKRFIEKAMITCLITKIIKIYRALSFSMSMWHVHFKISPW